MTQGAEVRGVPRLGWLSLFGGTCAVAGGLFAVTGEGLPCPFLALTGWLCPFCGASRMGVALLRGDLASAWGWNPWVLLLSGALALVWIWTAVRIVTRRPANLPGPLGAIDRWGAGPVVVGLTALSLVFMVLRNLL